MAAHRFILMTALLAALGARADVTLTFDSATQPATPTNAVVFTGSIQNSGATRVYLNDIRVDHLDGTKLLEVDTNFFFGNVPGILEAGEVFADGIFAVKAAPYARPGTYSGVVAILGGSNILATVALASNTIAVTVQDSVGDGIPDWWRQYYFGGSGETTNAENCASCDADGTGQDNWFKFVVGLNPTNPASVFTLAITNATAPTLVLGPVGVGRIVTLEAVDTLGEPWQPVETFTLLANSPRILLTDPAPPTQQRFYRINISLP